MIKRYRFARALRKKYSRSTMPKVFPDEVRFPSEYWYINIRRRLVDYNWKGFPFHCYNLFPCSEVRIRLRAIFSDSRKIYAGLKFWRIFFSLRKIFALYHYVQLHIYLRMRPRQSTNVTFSLGRKCKVKNFSITFDDKNFYFSYFLREKIT